MKAIHALILASLAGALTFITQSELFPPRLHAAPFVVPNTPDWRQRAIDDYPGGAKIDRAVGRLTDRLELSADQARQFKILLDRQREQTLALLLTGPANMTRNEFIARRKAMWAATREKLHAVLTPEQLVLMSELTAARPA